MARQGLKTVYRGEDGVVVTIDPIAASSCETELPRFGIRWRWE